MVSVNFSLENVAEQIEKVNTSNGSISTNVIKYDGDILDKNAYPGLGILKRVTVYTSSDLPPTLLANRSYTMGYLNPIKDPNTPPVIDSSGNPTVNAARLPPGSRIISCTLCNITRDTTGTKITPIAAGVTGTIGISCGGFAGTSAANANTINAPLPPSTLPVGAVGSPSEIGSLGSAILPTRSLSIPTGVPPLPITTITPAIRSFGTGKAQIIQIGKYGETQAGSGFVTGRFGNVLNVPGGTLPIRSCIVGGSGSNYINLCTGVILGATYNFFAAGIKPVFSCTIEYIEPMFPLKSLQTIGP